MTISTRTRLRFAVLLTAAGTALAGAIGIAPAHAATSDTGWFTDPISVKGRDNQIPVPSDPAAYDGPRRQTVAKYRTHAGALAVPAQNAVGHRLQAGQALTLDRRSYFPFDSPHPTKAAARQIRDLADALTNVRSVTCEGYADYGWKESHEKNLSRGRARAICRLVHKVAPQVSVSKVAYGSTHPVVVGGSRADRTPNRRVVLVVTSAVTPAAPAVTPAAPVVTPNAPPPTEECTPVLEVPSTNARTGAITPETAPTTCPPTPQCDRGQVFDDEIEKCVPIPDCDGEDWTEGDGCDDTCTWGWTEDESGECVPTCVLMRLGATESEGNACPMIPSDECDNSAYDDGCDGEVIR